jgi:hypothetical protein
MDSTSPVKTDVEYVFKVTRCSEPAEVRNLWNLEISTPTEPKLTELVNADSLSTVLSKITFVVEQDGY